MRSEKKVNNHYKITMKKILIFGTIATVLFIQCEEDTNLFLIGNGTIGNLTKEIQMRQVDSIFAGDSIVKLNPNRGALGTQGNVEIYEKGGQKLMLLSPENENDPNSVITNIQIFDERYTTDKGLSIKSTFGDLKANYEVIAVENAINSVVIFLKDSDVFITINKKQLPENIRYNISGRIEATQIPDEATFKYFMVGWDKYVEPDKDDSEE